jgi:hypothetical protein
MEHFLLCQSMILTTSFFCSTLNFYEFGRKIHVIVFIPFQNSIKGNDIVDSLLSNLKSRMKNKI